MTENFELPMCTCDTKTYRDDKEITIKNTKDIMDLAKQDGILRAFQKNGEYIVVSKLGLIFHMYTLYIGGTYRKAEPFYLTKGKDFNTLLPKLLETIVQKYADNYENICGIWETYINNEQKL